MLWSHVRLIILMCVCYYWVRINFISALDAVVLPRGELHYNVVTSEVLLPYDNRSATLDSKYCCLSYKRRVVRVTSRLHKTLQLLIYYSDHRVWSNTLLYTIIRRNGPTCWVSRKVTSLRSQLKLIYTGGRRTLCGQGSMVMYLVGTWRCVYYCVWSMWYLLCYYSDMLTQRVVWFITNRCWKLQGMSIYTMSVLPWQLWCLHTHTHTHTHSQPNY